MNHKLVVLFWVVSLPLFSQNSENKIKFGDIDIETVKEKHFAADTSVSAAVLYDRGDVNFDYRNGIVYIITNIHERIKIYKKAALDEANVELSVRDYGSLQREELLSGIKGYTYNIDAKGELIREKLTKEMIFKEKSSDYTNTTKFTLPNVKEGSVIEYIYTRETPFGVSQSPATWSFQTSKPVAWSEYNISVPNYFYYQMIMGGYLALYENSRKEGNARLGTSTVNTSEYHFVVKDAPAFVSEPFITTASDYISKIDFELAQVDIPGNMVENYSLDYKALASKLMASSEFGEIIKKTGFMKDAAKKILAETKDTTQLLDLAVKHINSTIKHNGNYSIWAKNLKKITGKGEGDVADINLSLICLLREMGFEAHPAILSTRSHGNVNVQFALLKKFNCVVAAININGKEILLDATQPLLPTGVLPPNYLNGVAVVILPTDYKIIEIIPNERNTELQSATMTLDDEGLLKGTLMGSYAGYNGWYAKEEYKDQGEEKYLKEIKEEKTGWNIIKATFSNQNSPTEAMKAEYELEISDQATVAGNMIYLKPMLTEGLTSNPFKTETRLFPIDFAMPLDETFLANITIPEGYEVAEKPESIAMSIPNNGGRFIYSVVVDGNLIKLNSRINIRKPVYVAEEYETLKNFYAHIIKKHAEQIVLKKKQ
jgi:hypothetical protein